MSSRRFVDLHTHSTASDGSLPPEEIVRLADQAGLAAVALTDHDTIAGIDQARRAAAARPELILVPGVEISAIFPRGMMHILGLGIDTASPHLAELTAQLQQARETRNPKIIQKLTDLGMDTSMEDVSAAARSYSSEPAGAPPRGQPPTARRILGRLHIALAMVRKGHVKTIAEAFDKYIGKDKPAYVDKECLPPSRAIEAIHAAGGLAVLAHPPQLQCENDAQFLRILRDLIHAGLDGIEAFHADNDVQQTRLYMELAKRFDLGITGGSDYHGVGKPASQLGKPTVPIEAMGEKFVNRLLGKCL